MKLMRSYTEVPIWWYAVIYLIACALAIVACEKFNLDMRWYMFLVCMLLPLIFVIPIGMIQAVTNQQPGLNIITELIFGYIYPGNAIGNVTFKVYGYIAMTQALFLVCDLKLGHYMKIPPRHMLIIQTLGTVLSAVIQLFVAYWLMDKSYMCDDTIDGNQWTCNSAATFFSASVIWGLIAPKKTFNDQDYGVILHGFWIGAILPVPFYFLAKKFPHSWVRNVHIPVILAACGSIPAPPADLLWFCIVGFIFNYWLKRYRTTWWERYAFAFSAGMDAGLAIATVVIFFALVNPGVELEWWGNEVSCRKQNKPTIAPIKPKKPSA
ncbi:hypothetical protein GQ42DRAFT_63417 [Ramicandelaber brevisporus]|nr:hypothetical protein GQ42DRAFT_63417 [Ramicandelaber brevisporus]